MHGRLETQLMSQLSASPPLTAFIFGTAELIEKLVSLDALVSLEEPFVLLLFNLRPDFLGCFCRKYLPPEQCQTIYSINIEFSFPNIWK